MLGVLVTFKKDGGFDRETLAAIAGQARGTFDGMPGLRLKSFTLDEAGRARNFYLWDDEEKARAFFTPEIVAMVTGLFGAPPAIEFLDVLELVDNSEARALL